MSTEPLFFLSHESILDLADLARDAYLSPQQRILGYTYMSDEDTDAQAYGSIENLCINGNSQRCIVLSFRGTESTKDGITDLAATRVPLDGSSVSFIKSFLPGSDGALVHWGFLEQYRSILPEIKRFVGGYPELDHVVCTGHSLGGALATIAAVDLHDRRCSARSTGPQRPDSAKKTLSCVTFGSPRVGNRSFTEKFNEIVGSRSLRFVNNDDPVPLMPSSLRFKHVPGCVYIESDHGPGYTSTRLIKSHNRWGKVVWNTISTTISCTNGSASDHSSDMYYEELAEILRF